MENEEDKIELRSEEFQEVLGRVPNWILRWGITMLALIALLLLVGSALFKYPDVITTTMTLTGTTPPAAIVAKTSGKLDSLYVGDNQSVVVDEYLAVIENPARTEDVLVLKEYLRTFVISEPSFLPPACLKLGTMQNSFAAFYSTLFNYGEFIRLNYYPVKKEFVLTRIAQSESQCNDLKRQRDLVRQQLELTIKQFSRDSLLLRKGGLSPEEYEQSRSRYLQSCLSYESVKTSLSNMSMQTMQMKEALLDIEQQYAEKDNTFHTQLNSQIQQLNNEIRNWEMNYVLSAPICGKITFTTYWVKNQNITVGEEVFSIIPSDSVELIGKAFLPMARSGKVKVGQKVNIRFENFPENEFGMVNGIVKNISLVPVKTETGICYAVEINLPYGLQTAYGKELPFLLQMNAQADIITEQMSLLQRFFMPLRKLLNEQLASR